MKAFMDLHTHTLAAGHAYSTLLENIDAALEEGIRYLGMSEHGPITPGGPHEFYFGNYKVIPREYDREEKTGRVIPQAGGRLRLFCGVEANIRDIDGTLDLDEARMQGMDYAIASIHPFAYTAGSHKENTLASVRAFQNPYVKILGHPDDGRFPLDYDELVREAKAAGVALEVNNSSLHPKSARQGGRENITELLKTCMKYDQAVIMGTDSHMCFSIGKFDEAEQLMRELEFPAELVLNYDPENIRKLINITLD